MAGRRGRGPTPVELLQVVHLDEIDMTWIELQILEAELENMVKGLRYMSVRQQDMDGMARADAIEKFMEKLGEAQARHVLVLSDGDPDA